MLCSAALENTLFAGSLRFSSEFFQITGIVKLKDGDVVDISDILSDLTINIRQAGIRKKDTLEVKPQGCGSLIHFTNSKPSTGIYLMLKSGYAVFFPSSIARNEAFPFMILTRAMFLMLFKFFN